MATMRFLHGGSAALQRFLFAVLTILIVSIFPPPARAQNGGPQAVANPAQVAQEETLTLHLSGFAGNTQVTIMLDNVKVSLWSDYTNAEGSLDKQVKVPLSFSDGTHRIVVTDASGNGAEADITVQGNYVPASIQLQPNNGIPGVNVVITGSNWQRNPKTVVMQGPGGSTRNLPATDLCVVQDCPSGSLHLDTQIPAGAAAGVYSVTVSDGMISASATLNVLQVVNPISGGQPGLVLQPPSGPTQSYVTVSGSGFSSNAVLWVEWDGNQIDPQQALMRTDTQGLFSGMIVQVPIGATPGAHKVLVMDGTVRAQTTFTVSSQTVTPPPVVNPPAPAPGPGPAPPPPPTPTPAPAPSGCNAAIPMYAQPGCAGGNTNVAPTPAPGPNPTPTPSPAPGGCNPSIPMYTQPGCAGGGTAVTPTPAPGPNPAPTSPAGGCNPGIPAYGQPGCAAGQTAVQSVAPRQQPVRPAPVSAQARISPQAGNSSGSASATARTAQPCKPNVPKYTQPGCVSK